MYLWQTKAPQTPSPTVSPAPTMKPTYVPDTLDTPAPIAMNAPTISPKPTMTPVS